MEPGAKEDSPGLETRNQPDEADEVDADDVLQGVGVDGLRRVRRVVWWFLVEC